MMLQVVNTRKEKFNQIRTTKENLFTDLKTQGWDLKDCKVSELKDFMEQISKGKTSYLTFENDGKHFYFPKNIIENSIISLLIT